MADAAATKPKTILMVLSNAPRTEDAPGGWYYPEAAHPLKVFQSAGHEVTFASPKGGLAPLDPTSGDLSGNPELEKLAAETVSLDKVHGKDFDVVFFVGGFGVMFDFPNDENVQRVTRECYEAGGIAGAVCHGPIALINVKLSDGSYLVAGKNVVAFANIEEDAVGRAANLDKMPKHDDGLQSCEDLLVARGANFVGSKKAFACATANSARVITGQNPASAEAVAQRINGVLALDGSAMTYFNLPGRAGTSRIMLAAAGVNFDDRRIQKEEWMALKPKTPWGSLPMFTLPDGTDLAQTHAIELLIAKQTGFYPADPVTAAKVDMVVGVLDDIAQATNKAGAGLPQAEKEAARKAEYSEGGKAAGLIAKLEAFAKANGSEGHVVGNSFTLADFLLFVGSSMFVSGFYDGVPKTIFDATPCLNSARKAVGSLPLVQAFYAKNTDPLSQLFKTIASTL